MDPSIQSKPRPDHARRARSRKKSLLLMLAAGVALFAVAALALQFYLKPTVYRLAVGPAGSDDEKLVQALAGAFATERNAVRLMPVVTSGSAESLSLFAEGKVDLAIGRGDLDMPRDAEMVAIVRRDFVVLWTLSPSVKKNRKAAIKSLDELPGHQVGIIGRSDANLNLLKQILTASGVDPDKVQFKKFATNQLDELARDPGIDAFMTVGPLNSQITLAALEATARTRGQPKFLAIDVSEAIAEKNRVYSSEEIPGSVFKANPAWPEDKIETTSISHLIVARKSLSETKIAALTRQIFAARHSLGRDVPSAAQLKKPDTDKDTALPLHRGAAAYIDGNEKTFLDGYSDYIWFAILALSGIGSAAAWLRRFFMRDEWEGINALREKIAILITRSREAQSTQMLSDLDEEADALIDETLDCYNDDIIDEEDLSILNLMIQRYYHVSALRQKSLDTDATNENRLRAI